MSEYSKPPSDYLSKLIYVNLFYLNLVLAPDRRSGTYYCQIGDQAHLTGGNC